MAEECKKTDLQNLPTCAAEFIKLVIKKMRYRKKVRLDVQAELGAHFEDELRDCKTNEEKEQKAQRLIEDFGDVNLLGVLLRRAKKRCRPLWRTIVARTFQTIGVLILCFILYCIYISLGKPTIWVNYVEEMTRIARPVADESLNAAPIYRRAIDAYKEPPEIKREVVDPFASMLGMPSMGDSSKYVPKSRAERKTREPRMEKVSLLVAISNKDWIDDLNEDELSALKQWISNNSEAINFFKQASQRPHCWWKREAKDNLVLNILLPELSPLRNIAKMMVWQSKLKAHNGHIEEAFDDLLVCYRAGRHFKGPRLLIEQLVGIAIQALSTRNVLAILTNQEVDSQLLRNLQIRLEKLMAEDTYTISYEVERFCVLDFIQRCYTNNGRGSGHMIPGRVQEFMHAAEEAFLPPAFLPSLAVSIASADRCQVSRKFEKFYSTFEKCATKTPWQLHKECFDFEMDLDNWSTLKKARYWPASWLLPALGGINRAAYRHKTQVEAVITTLAVIRFKQSTGNYPENLEELVVTGYLKKIPLDPFSDKSLVYKKTDGNFILYSVGLNFKDDGGQVYRGKEGKKPHLWDNEFGDAVFWPMPR